MKLFNIGIPELIFILIIALIVLGPDGIVKTARTLGKTIRKIIRSPIWSMMIDTQRELRDMPTKLVREAGIEEDLAEIRKTSRDLNKIGKDLNKTSPPISTTIPPVTPAQPPTTPPTTDLNKQQETSPQKEDLAEPENEIGGTNSSQSKTQTPEAD